MDSLLKQFAQSSQLGANADYIEDLYEQYLVSADSVGPAWKAYFDAFKGREAGDIPRSAVILDVAVVAGAWRRLAGSRATGRGGNVVDDRRMRHVAGFAALEAVEPGFPGGTDAVGRNEVLLVQVLDEAGIGAQLRGLRKLLQGTVHSGIGKLEGGGGPCNIEL